MKEGLLMLGFRLLLALYFLLIIYQRFLCYKKRREVESYLY